MFPANAGVIPKYYREEHGLSYVPRKRGGDPYFISTIPAHYACSPQTRG